MKSQFWGIFLRFQIALLASFFYCAVSSVASAQVLNNKNSLPEIGVVAANTLSLDEEVAIGNIFYSQLRGQAGVLQDPVVNQYVQSLGNEMVIHAENTKFPFTFFVINNSAINAMAFYGGHVGIHTGLVFHADTEAELAAVIGHEIAHVTQRHIVRKKQAMEKTSPLQVASMIGGALLMMASPQAGLASIYAGQAGMIQNAINHTRAHEREADRIGMRILAEAGFDPFAAASFFGKMLEQRRWGSTPPAFLLTHPLSQERVAEARNRAENLPSQNRPSSQMFHLVKARIHARYMYSAQASLAYFTNSSIAKEWPSYAWQYGLALAYMGVEKYVQAQKILERLVQTEPENFAYLDALTDTYIGLSNAPKAIQLLQPVNQKIPNNPVITLNLANSYIENKDWDSATELLKDFLMVNDKSLLGFSLISDAYARSQARLNMHQNKAEMYALMAIYPKAIDELQYAYNFAESYLLKQRIRARISQFRESQERMQKLAGSR